MGWMFVIGACIACKKQITFNPDWVPSLTVNGNREPLCRECAIKWGRIHNREVHIHPQAYEPQECA